MRFPARSISSAPVTTRRTLRTLRHFSASASSRQDAGSSGNNSRCTEPSVRRIAREPGLLGGERQHGRQPGHRGAKQLIEHGQARLAGHRGDRIAVERVLADVEVERRKVRGHEGVERGEDALVVELGIGPAHLARRARPAGAASAARAPACGRAQRDPPRGNARASPASSGWCCAACGRSRPWS